MRTVAPLVVAAVAAVAFYGLAYWIRGFRFPIGFDTYFYVGAIRAAGRYGLADSHITARPGYPLMAATMGWVLQTRPWATAVVLPFAMAAAMGLAGAALAARWGISGWTLGLIAMLTAVCGVVGRLVAGRSENLMTILFLTAALAVAVWAPTMGVRLAVGFLILVSGLTESPFLVAFLAILGAAVVAQPLMAWAGPRLPRVLRARARTRPWTEATPGDGRPRRGTAWGEPRPGGLSLSGLAAATLAGAAVAAVTLLVWNATLPANAIQRLPPTSLFRSRLFTELRIGGAFPGVLLVVGGWWSARRTAPGSAEPVRRLLSMWLLITGVVVLIGMTGLRAPTYRAITFGVPIALGLAAAPVALLVRARGTADRRRRARLVAAAVVAVISVMYPASVLWFRDQRSPATREQVGQIAAAAHYLRSLPPGTTAVIAVDDQPAIRAYFNQRLAEAVVPASRRMRIVVVPGRAEDAAAGVPSPRTDPLSREVVDDLFGKAKQLLDAGAPVLALRDFDATGYLRVLTTGGPVVGSDVAVVRGPSPDPNLAGSVPGPFAPLPRGPTLLLDGLAALLVLGLAGGGWVRLAIPSAPAMVLVGLAPAFGAAMLAVLSLAAVHAGQTLAGSGAPVIVAFAVGSSVGLLLRVRRPTAPHADRLS
jgi:hypothetical protein